MSVSANKSKTTTTPTNPQWVEGPLRTHMGRIDSIGGADPFSFVAGPSALQTQAFETIGGLGSFVPDAFSRASSAMQGAADYRPTSVTAPGVSPMQAFSSLGAADPTSALARSLSGSVDNPYLAAMNQANINQSMQGYNDALGAAASALTRQALPAVRSGAMLAGQYGGSRQGIAEGLALEGFGNQAAQNARNLAQSAMDSGNQLYGGAYEGAQNRMAQTASALAGMGVDNARANADRDLQAQTTNAANGLAGAQLNLAAGQGIGAMGQYGLDALGQLGGTQQALQAAYQRAPLDLLNFATNAYSGLPLEMFRGSATTQKGSGLNVSLDDIGRIGAFVTSDPRVKRNVFRIGHDPGGRNVYGYHYDWDPPWRTPRIGHMADEVAQTDPEAVAFAPNGLAMVNTGVLQRKNDLMGNLPPPPELIRIPPMGDPAQQPAEAARPKPFSDWSQLRSEWRPGPQPARSKPFQNWNLLRGR